MNNFIFQNSTKVYFGKNCVKNFLEKELTNYGPNVLLGYGYGSIKKNGVYDEVINILNKTKKNVVEFGGIMANPTFSKVLDGAKIVQDCHIDLILAVGGGSVMDCCKAISLVARYNGNSWNDFWINRGNINFNLLPVGTVVTLPASGSEVNGGAVITEEKSKIKMDRDYPEMNPQFSFLDPSYMQSLSERQLKSGGFDILSHVMETYFSKPDLDNLSDDLSIALMKSIVRSLNILNEDFQDYNARSNLMWAGSLAENRLIKMGKETDFTAHNIAHQISAYSNANHGNTLAVIQPKYYRRIFKQGINKFKRFANEVWQVDSLGQSDEEISILGIESLEKFINSLGLYKNLKQLGVKDKHELKDIADSCYCNEGCYRKLENEEILNILEESYE